MPDLGIKHTNPENVISALLCKGGHLINRYLTMMIEYTLGRINNNQNFTFVLDFEEPDYDKIDVIRKKNSGENIESTLYRICNSIKSERKQLNKWLAEMKTQMNVTNAILQVTLNKDLLQRLMTMVLCNDMKTILM